jgi:hypothetical protein
MATGFGVDPVTDTNGVPTSGMTSDDMQSIWGGLYSPGLVSGGAVTLSPSGLTYTVSAGVAAVPISSGKVVLAPIPAGIVTVSSPGTSRTDLIYAQQHFPSLDGDAQMTLGAGTTLPPRAVLLDSYTLGANALNTASGIRTGDINYSIPYGGSLGVLAENISTYNGTIAEINTSIYYLNGSFTLPTDRRLRFQFTVSCSSADGDDGVRGTWVEPQFAPQLDNVDLVVWSFRAIGSWTTQTFTYDTINTVPAGQHTVRMRRQIYSPTGRQAALHYGGGQVGATFTVEDLGVAR